MLQYVVYFGYFIDNFKQYLYFEDFFSEFQIKCVKIRMLIITRRYFSNIFLPNERIDIILFYKRTWYYIEN